MTCRAHFSINFWSLKSWCLKQYWLLICHFSETTNNEQHDIQDDIADAFDNFYNKTTFEEVERSRFLVSDAQLLEGPPRAISNAFDNSYNKTNLKEMEKSRFLVSDAQLLEGPPTSLDKKSSKTKFSKPFGLSLRKKKNHQKSNQMRDDGTKTKKMTFIEDEWHYFVPFFVYL